MTLYGNNTEASHIANFKFMECSTDIKGGANILANNKEYKYHNKQRT